MRLKCIKQKNSNVQSKIGKIQGETMKKTMKKLVTMVMAVVMIMGLSVMISAEENLPVMPLETSEGDAIMTTNEIPVPTLYDVTATLLSVDESVMYMDNAIVSDVKVQLIDGVVMVPLRSTLEKLGFTVNWNSETKSIEIFKGAQWTSITIGNNAYFKNKMAPHALSAAPVIVTNRTLVPAEFFAEILSRSIQVENNQLVLSDDEAVIQEGFVKSITVDATGTKTITLTSDMTSDSFEIQTIIHTTESTTFFQKEIKEGDYVQVVASMIMTMSLPGQTSGYIVY